MLSNMNIKRRKREFDNNVQWGYWSNIFRPIITNNIK